MFRYLYESQNEVAKKLLPRIAAAHIVSEPTAQTFGNSKGDWEVQTFREFFIRFLSRHGIPSVRFHALRHTFATRCIEAGGDCKTVSELLGHATVNLTLNLYVHPQMEQKRSCVERLEMF